MSVTEVLPFKYYHKQYKDVSGQRTHHQINGNLSRNATFLYLTYLLVK